MIIDAIFRYGIIIGGILICFFLIYTILQSLYVSIQNKIMTYQLHKIDCKRKKYNVLSIEILNSIDDDELDIVIYEYIINKIIKKDNFKDQYNVLESLNISYKVIFYTMYYEQIMINGGFRLFFDNIKINKDQFMLCVELLKSEDISSLLNRAFEYYDKYFNTDIYFIEMEYLNNRFIEIAYLFHKNRIIYIRNNIEEFVTI